MVEKFKNSLEVRLNVKYFLVQGIYWMLYCCTLSYASAFMLGKGYSSTGFGMILALSFFVAAFVQQIISSWADKATKISLPFIISIMIAFLGILEFILGQTKGKGFVTGFVFFLVAVTITSIMPLCNALNFYLEKAGVKMNFGVARAGGSLFFFFISLIVGNLMKNVTINVAPKMGFILCILMLCDIGWILWDLKEINIRPAAVDNDPFDSNKLEDKIQQIKYFISKYRIFFLILVGTVGVYYGHVVINNFLYQIVVSVEGDASVNGGVLALQAIVELPGMIFFEKLREKIGTKKLYGIAVIFFLVKIFITTIANSIGMLYVSVLFQSLSFALFLPASVHLVDEIMDEKDAIKGQSFVTVAMTVGNLLSCLTAGVIIDVWGTKIALILGTIVTLLGMIVSLYGLVRINAKK